MADARFNSNQFQSIYPDGIEKHYWNNARNHIIFKFLKQHHLNNEIILEIGGGRGVVARFLHDRGIDITSTELASVNPVRGTEDYFMGNTDAFELPEVTRSRFTVILLLDVIEHIEEPILFMEKILQYFPAMKYFIVTVPARKELWTNYDEFNGHYRRYNLDDLKTIDSQYFDFYMGGYFFHLLYPVFYGYSKLLKSRKTAIKAPAGVNIVVHKVLSVLLQLDYRLLYRNLPGSSLIVSFKKITVTGKPQLKT